MLYQLFKGYLKQCVRQHQDTVNICSKQEVRSGCLYLFCISESSHPWSELRTTVNAWWCSHSCGCTIYMYIHLLDNILVRKTICGHQVSSIIQTQSIPKEPSCLTKRKNSATESRLTSGGLPCQTQLNQVPIQEQLFTTQACHCVDVAYGFHCNLQCNLHLTHEGYTELLQHLHAGICRV